jgi:uncharacterized protein
MNQLIDSFYTALKTMSVSDLSPHMTEDFVLNWQGIDQIPWAGSWYGVQGLLDFFKQLNAYVEIVHIERLHQFSDREATVVVLRGHWRMKASGQEIRAIACNIFRIQVEKIQSYTVVNNTAAFAQALTLPK